MYIICRLPPRQHRMYLEYPKKMMKWTLGIMKTTKYLILTSFEVLHNVATHCSDSMHETCQGTYLWTYLVDYPLVISPNY